MRLYWIFPILMGLTASTAFASGDVLSSASVKLSGLSFSIVDLDLEDGITPQISFGNSGLVLRSNEISINPDAKNPFYLGGYQPVTENYVTIQEQSRSLPPGAPLNLTGSGTVSVQGSGSSVAWGSTTAGSEAYDSSTTHWNDFSLQATSVVDADVLNRFISMTPEGRSFIVQAAGLAGANNNALNFTLTPNTGLYIHATVDVQTYNGNGLFQDAQYVNVGQDTVSYRSAAALSAELIFDKSNKSLYSDHFLYDSSTQGKSVNFSLDNYSNTSQSAQLKLTLDTANIFHRWTNVPSPVPEPSQMTLIALGLMGLLRAVTRRQGGVASRRRSA